MAVFDWSRPESDGVMGPEVCQVSRSLRDPARPGLAGPSRTCRGPYRPSFRLHIGQV